MKILYFGTVCNAENYENMIADYKVKPSVASLVFENALMEGFKQVKAEIDIFSFPMIPAFPKCGKLFWGAEKETLSSGYKTTWIPTINITGLKQWSQGVKTHGIIKKWLKAGHVIKFIVGVIAVSIVGIMGISILGMVDSIFDFRKVKSCELI